MVEITASSARLISKRWAALVPSPAYDSMSPEQRRSMRLQNPWSFLNVTLSPEDLGDDENISHQQLITLARESLDRILESGAFAENETPAMYLYRLQTSEHEQTGLIADIPISDYENGSVKIHEQVRRKRATLLAEHLYQLGISSSPIALTFENNELISSLMQDVQRSLPDLQIAAEFGVEQTIWKIIDVDLLNQFTAAFRDHSLYIIDGHHRAAASLATRQRENSKLAQNMFGAMFPHDSLKLLGFNRWIRQHDALDRDVIIKSIQTLPDIHRIDSYVQPEPGNTVCYADGRWWRIALQGDGFDSQLLFEKILQPCFGLQATDDTRIVNTPGNQDWQLLQRQVDEAGIAAFYLAPLSIEQFIQAADSGTLLPPKSTFFTPKVQSGVFLRPLRD